MTTTTYRKKMIEVALPLEAINIASAREKSIRHGHPSTLHLWWARRPLAACRAVLFSSLVNDPSDDPMYGVDEDTATAERDKLHNLIEELVQWENSNNPNVINRVRLEIARSIAANKVADGELEDDAQLVSTAPELPEEQAKYLPDPPPEYTPHDVRFKAASLKPEQVNHFLAHYAPPVLDPFAGGGSIPLEAQRLGLRAYASDLNPVPVLINKALIEIPPKFAGQPPVNPECSKQDKLKTKAATVWNGAEGSGRRRALLRQMDAGRGREAHRTSVSQGQSHAANGGRRTARFGAVCRAGVDRYRMALGKNGAESPNPGLKGELSVHL